MNRALLSLGIAVGISALVFWAVVLSQNWVSNVSEFNGLVFSGIIVITFGAGASLVYEALKKSEMKVISYPGETKPSPVVQSFLAHSQPVFETDLSPKQIARGNVMTFKVKFKGLLDHACLQADLKTPKGKWYSFPNYRTLSRNPDWFTRGELTGFYDQEFEWKDVIPQTIPPGEYTFNVRAYERTPYRLWIAFKLHVLLFLKAHWIRSIDTKVLEFHEWKPIYHQEHDVVISG